MSRSVSWEYYVKRRKLNVVAWLRNKKIHTYMGLLEECERRSIIPPKHDVVKDLLAAAADGSVPKSVVRPKGRVLHPKPKIRSSAERMRNIPPQRPAPKPVPKQPVKAPPVRKKPEPKKSPAPMANPFVKSVLKHIPKSTTKEDKSVPEPAPAPIVKEPEKKSEKIVWNFMMRKGQLLELAQLAGIAGLSIKSTKAQIVGSLVKAGYPESQA